MPKKKRRGRRSPGNYGHVLFLSLGVRDPVYHRLVHHGWAKDSLNAIVSRRCRKGRMRLHFAGVNSLPRVHAEAFGRACRVCFAEDPK